MERGQMHEIPVAIYAQARGLWHKLRLGERIGPGATRIANPDDCDITDDEVKTQPLRVVPPPEGEARHGCVDD